MNLIAIAWPLSFFFTMCLLYNLLWHAVTVVERLGLREMESSPTIDAIDRKFNEMVKNNNDNISRLWAKLAEVAALEEEIRKLKVAQAERIAVNRDSRLPPGLRTP